MSVYQKFIYYFFSYFFGGIKYLLFKTYKYRYPSFVDDRKEDTLNYILLEKPVHPYKQQTKPHYMICYSFFVSCKI
jgi:hypothetical protein